MLSRVLLDEKREPIERQRAAEALGAIGNEGATDALETTLGTRNPRLRQYAVWALGNIYAKSQDQKKDSFRETEVSQSLLEQVGRLLADRPSSSSLHYLRGKLLSTFERYAEAAAELDRALALTVEPHGEVYAERASVFVLLGRHADAIRDYTAAIDRGLSTADVHFRKAVSLGSIGSLSDAAEEFSAALKVDPTFAEALLERASVYEKLNQIQSAINDLQSYIHLKGSGPEAEIAIRRLEQSKNPSKHN